MKSLRVCLDARLVSGISGGVEQVVVGLACGLSNLNDGDEEYHFFTYVGGDEWIQPFLHGPCRTLPGPAVPRQAAWKRILNSSVPVVRDVWHKVSPVGGRHMIRLPQSDGTIERARIDVMHFTKQDGFLTKIPSIYHPHDLQHIHLPQFFTPRVRLDREIRYRAFCDQASMVAVNAAWGKRDLVQHYNLAESKVKIVPFAPASSAYPAPLEDDLTATRQRYNLPGEFAFYPAQTWPHKNHLGVLSALVILRDRYGLKVPFVSTGHLSDYFSCIKRRISELRLSEQVQFLGFVSPLELQCIYQLCRCVVVPTRFEAGSFPLWEAFAAGVPSACSNVTSLPEQAGDAALLFSPENNQEIADAIRSLWVDEALRTTLVARGKKRVARFTWDRTARTFRAYYRRIGGRCLTEEDQELLRAPDSM